MSFKYNNKDILLHFELSNKCNSQCPGCPRFLSNTPHINPALTLSEVRYDDFINWIPDKVWKQVSKINMCGGHGDPILCKDLIKILKFIKEKTDKNKCHIEIRTNGGTRGQSFWEEMGQISDERTIVIFSIDGTESTNDKYRRNVKWKVLENNIKTFVNNGGYGVQECLIFKHNHHEKEEIKTWNKNIGLKKVTFKRAIGFDDYVNKKSRPMPVYDKIGEIEYILEPSEENIPEGFVYDKMDYRSEIFFINESKKSCEFLPEKVELSKYNYFNSTQIECRSILPDTVEYYVNTHGVMYPCCYIPTHENIKVPIDEINQIKDILDNSKNEYDLNFNNFDNIVDLFNRDLASTWDKKVEEGKCLYCSRQCGVDKSISNLFFDNPPNYKLTV